MKLLFVIIILTFTFAQDEFFEPITSIGGYGELHWNQTWDKDGNKISDQMDFHRFIIFISHNYTEKWSVKSELEIEHNMIDGSGDYDGEVELEQAYVNYHAGNWGFKTGVILASVGYINETHEPPTFLSVERPDYAKYIIPTTWFGNGFGFYGNYSGIDWKVNFMEDLLEAGIGDGIRDARGKGYKTTAYNWTKNVKVDYNGMSGINMGYSMIFNNAPDLTTLNSDGSVVNSVGVMLMELHGKYNKNNIMGTFEYGNISYTDNAVSKGTSGYYLDIGYDISDMVGYDGKIVPWFRYGNISKDIDTSDTDAQYNVMKFGVAYWPVNQVVFKADYGTTIYPNHSSKDGKSINIGMGYMI